MAGSAGFTLGELAAALGATLEGDPTRVVTAVAPLASARAHDISFLTDSRYRDAARTSRAGAFVAPMEAMDLPAPVLRCAAPQQALIQLLTLFHPETAPKPGIDPSAVVAPDAHIDGSACVGALSVVEAGARIGARVRLYPQVYVGAGVEIGEGSVIYPHVTLRDGVRLGRRVIVHPGAVLGADGFGYAFHEGAHRKIPQVGGVRVEDDVEIGANTTIDRATFGDTVIGRGTKIDNLVQLGHNVEVGEHCIIVSQVGVSGSSRLGRGVVLAGQVGVADHVNIGDGALIGARSGVAADVAAGEKLLGTPARSILQAKRIMLAEGKLPELIQRVRALERRLQALEGHAPADNDADA